MEHFNKDEYFMDLKNAKEAYSVASKPYFDRLLLINQLKPYRGKFVKSEFGLQEVLVNLNQEDAPEETELKKIIAELEEKYLGKFI